MRETRWAAAMAALVLLGTTLVPVAAAAPIAPGGDGLRIESRTTYTFDPVALVVHVRYEADLQNTQPDVVRGDAVSQRYYPSFAVPAVAEAVAVVATGAGGATLPVSVEPTSTPLFVRLVADLRPDLFHPDTVRLTVTYDIPARPPRTEAVTRVNRAFATFPAFAVGDPGLTSVEVVIPDGWEVEIVGDAMVEEERDGAVAYTAEAIADPDAWQADVVARNDDELVVREVDLGEHDVQVQGWPDDAAWADFVADQVGRGVPVLEELIGQDWPARADIDVVETAAPYFYGFAGWFRPDRSLIEVGDALDQQIILHELSHVWFNGSLFSERWINEGLAEDFSTQAMASLGAEEPVPDEVRADDPGVLRLNAWGDPDLQDGQSAATEAYGYNTSWSVVARLTDEVGPERMVAILQAAEAHALPYTAETVPGVLSRAGDWRTFLDLFEEVGRSTMAEQVVRELVIEPDQAALLDERRAARSEYAVLLAAGDGWSPPLSIRTDMAEWRFADVLAQLDDAADVLTTRDQLADALAPIDEAVPVALQEAYEGAGRVDLLAAEADRALAAGEALRDAQGALDGVVVPIDALGLLGSGAEDDLSAARRALRAGDYAETSAQAASVSDQVDGARSAGVLRLLVAGLILVLVLLAGGRLRGPWRSARQRPDRWPPTASGG